MSGMFFLINVGAVVFEMHCIYISLYAAVVGERALLGRAADVVLLLQQQVRLLRGLLLQRHEFLPRDRHRFDYSCYSVTRIAKQAQRCKPKTAIATVEPNAHDFFNDV